MSVLQFVLPDADDLQLQTSYSHQLVDGRPLYQTTCTIEGMFHNILYTPFRVEMWPDVKNGNTFSTLSDWISLDHFGKLLYACTLKKNSLENHVGYIFTVRTLMNKKQFAPTKVRSEHIYW